MCSMGDVDLHTNVLLEHRPSKTNIYSENKTHSHEEFKKQEEKEGREGDREEGERGLFSSSQKQNWIVEDKKMPSA